MQTQYQQLSKILNQVVDFSPTEIALANFTFQQYQPKDFIFTVNDIPSKIYITLQGIGRYFYIDKKGKEINKSLVKTGGSFASISSLVSKTPSPLYTQAITDLTVAVIEYADVINLAEHNLKWATFIRRSYENLTIEKEQREISLLMLSAKERYQEFLQQFGEESQQIPLNQIAMYLGITDVSLSRLRRELNLT